MRRHTPAYTQHVREAEPARVAVSWDLPGTGAPGPKGFLSFETREEMLLWYSRQTPKCCYEILRETAPIALGFDIECKFADERHERVRIREGLDRDPGVFLEQLMRRMGEAFPKLAGRTPLKSSSHKPGAKISWHLKYADLFLRDMRDRDAFKADVTAKLGSLVPLIDTGIWGSNHNLRLPWSHKKGDASRPLIPADCNAAWSPDAIHGVERHMWTYVPPGATPVYDLPPPGATPVYDLPPPDARKRERAVASTDVRATCPRAMTHTRVEFETAFGMTYEAFLGFMKALPAAGGCGKPRSYDGDDVSAEIYWYTCEVHTWHWRSVRAGAADTHLVTTRCARSGALHCEITGPALPAGRRPPGGAQARRCQAWAARKCSTACLSLAAGWRSFASASG